MKCVGPTSFRVHIGKLNDKRVYDMKYKKIGLALIIATALTACGGGDTPEAQSRSAKTSPAEASAPAPTEAAKPVPKATLTPEQLGKKAFARCATCHTLDEGGRNRVGPNLWGIFGRKAGTGEGFAYSKAMIASEVVWDDASIDAYIANPRTFMPKNKMVFVGLRKEDDRENVIAYLKANTGAE